jgi:hypothetical protein
MRTARLVLALLAFALMARIELVAQDKKKADKKVEPTILVILPLGLQPGRAEKVTIRGLHLEGAKEVRITGGAAEVRMESQGKAGVPDKNPEKVGDTQVVANVKLAADVSADVKVTVVTPLGESRPHTLLVETKRPLVSEKEPNDGFRKPQTVTLPAMIQGTIDRPRDVDVFHFQGKKGQAIRAEVFADRHGSALDAQLILYRRSAIQVAASEDTVQRDPILNATLPADDDYFLVLSDAHDTGSTIHAYRILLQ